MKKKKKCKFCPKYFEPKTVNSKYCSDRCKYFYGKRERDKVTKRPKTGKYGIAECDFCKKEYVKSIFQQKYCNKECAKLKCESDKEHSYFSIFKRDGFRCVYCGKSSILDEVKLQIDHVYPRAKGGGNELHNLVTSCSDCNTRKNNNMLDIEVICEIWERNKLLNTIKFDEVSYEVALVFFNTVYPKINN